MPEIAVSKRTQKLEDYDAFVKMTLSPREMQIVKSLSPS